MFSFCVLVSDKVPPPLPPSTILYSGTPPYGQASSVMRSPRYYGHFFWPHGKTAIHFLVKKNLRQYGHPTANCFFGPNRVLRLVLIWLHFWWCHERFGSEVKRSQKTASLWQWQSNICVRWGEALHDAIASVTYIN